VERWVLFATIIRDKDSRARFYRGYSKTQCARYIMPPVRGTIRLFNLLFISIKMLRATLNRVLGRQNLRFDTPSWNTGILSESPTDEIKLCI